MAWLDLVLWLVALAAAAAAAREAWRQNRRIDQIAGQMRGAAARLVEARYLGDLGRRLADVQLLTEDVIDTGAATVRAVHLGISRIPFGILESIPVTRDTTRVVRQTHDLITEAVYGSIRGVNKAAGQVTRAALGVNGRTSPDARRDLLPRAGKRDDPN